jgi:hypothetical protein
MVQADFFLIKGEVMAAKTMAAESIAATLAQIFKKAA